MKPDAATNAILVGPDTPVRLWGLSGGERLQRQLRRAQLQERAATDELPSGGLLLFMRGWIFDEPLISALRDAPVGTLLCDPKTGIAVAAHVGTTDRSLALRLLGQKPPQGTAAAQTPETLAGSYNNKLRKRETPYLLPLTEDTRSAIEKRMFAGSYKGVTDLVTKYVWPWPARHVTRWCAQLGLTPNLVTAASGLLVVAAFMLFWRGQFAAGLICAWGMTFLDTIDGKLARVTLTSSKFGDVFDHGIDLIHPPFWWWAWIVGLNAVGQPLGDASLVLSVVLAGYVLQRVQEGIFIQWFGIEIHTWRRWDSFFRLITARRNPNLLILSVAVLFGAPGFGMELVAWWTALCFAIHGVQIVQAARARKHGPIRSWLSAP